MPVLVTMRRELRSATSFGRMPFLASSNIHRGLVPSFVILYLPMILTYVSRSGWKGLPSYMTTWAPMSSWPTLARYMIHPVVVYCIATESGPEPSWSRPSLKRLSRMGPTAWTMALGIPVVPEE